MRAFTLDRFEATPGLRDDLPVPELGEGDVLVRIHASAVNPVDAYTAMGALKGMMEYEFPVILGRDLAGVIERVGAGVTRYAVGDEVFGWVAKTVLHDGTYADYIALPADQFTATKPASVDFVAAAAVPLAASTASIALDALNLAQGDRVLVVGAPGGVGSFFVQLAADRGAHVIATALAQDEPTCATSVPPRPFSAATTSPPRSASATATASTPCSISSAASPRTSPRWQPP